MYIERHVYYTSSFVPVLSDMLNLTSRNAAKVQTGMLTVQTPGHKNHVASLTCSDFLPDDSGVELHKYAVLYIMEVLVSEFRSLNLALSNLQTFLPLRESPHALQMSLVVAYADSLKRRDQLNCKTI